MCQLKGEVTIFLSLLLGLILLFLSALIQSATVAVDKSYARSKANLAVESVFAEYHQTLMEEFHIFALDGTYESGNYEIENLENRLGYYGLESEKLEVTQLQLLSDQGAAAYEEQIITYMTQKYGITYLEDLLGTWSIGETQRVEGEESDALDQLKAEMGELEVEVDYLEQLDFLYKLPILSLVVPETSTLSQGAMEADTLPSNRVLETGVASYDLDNSNTIWNQMLVSEYILDHFTTALDTPQELEDATKCTYEVEYILAGEDSDEENLEEVANQILLIRMGVNYIYLMESTTKKAEVSALALTIATAAGFPLMSEALEQVLLIGWAYGEGIMDVKSLMEGNALSLVKSEEEWQLSLSNLFDLGTEDVNVSTANAEDGMGYEDYLRVLLYLEGYDIQIMRSLDMVEYRMIETYGLEYFQVDTCITQLQFLNTWQVGMGYTYEFPVAFTYE